MVDIVQGLRASISFTISQQDLKDFQRISGDFNPIHSDIEFARRHGYEKPIVFGGLLVAKISQFIGTQIPGAGCLWHSLSIQFRNPLFTDETAMLQAQVTYANSDLKVAQMQMTIYREKTLIAEGKVQVGYGEK
jgi:3-hydroxybutyryl-CoA dehydratase